MKSSALMGARACAVGVGLMWVLSGCRSPVVDPVDPGNPGGPVVGGGGGGPTPTPTGTGQPIPTPDPDSSPTPAPSSPVSRADSCLSSDPDHQCLGLKLVSLVDPQNGIPSINGDDAVTLISEINTIWSQCNLAFQLENYEAVDPTTIGLDYGPSSENELTDLRERFSDTSTFLVVITGPWNGRTIAWTEEGGASAPFGTIVDQQYGHNPMTVGHELGHYMGLYHISNSGNLMNPYIGSNTSGLTSSQCQTARETNSDYWQKMFRR